MVDDNEEDGGELEEVDGEEEDHHDCFFLQCLFGVEKKLKDDVRFWFGDVHAIFKFGALK